ncbi:hypothetical protein Trydic_g12985 [Trypoxylus dichotomus]
MRNTVYENSRAGGAQPIVVPFTLRKTFFCRQIISVQTMKCYDGQKRPKRLQKTKRPGLGKSEIEMKSGFSECEELNHLIAQAT